MKNGHLRGIQIQVSFIFQLMVGGGKSISFPWIMWGQTLIDQKEIEGVIYSLYMNLFGRREAKSIHLKSDAWKARGRLQEGDNEILLKPFTKEEVKATIFGMREDSAPGPDDEFMLMVNDFYLGGLDISRLNYGVITLVLKVKDANNVKQF